MEQCQACGPTLAVTQMFAIKQCLVTCIVATINAALQCHALVLISETCL